jgi:hypothetical protein
LLRVGRFYAVKMDKVNKPRRIYYQDAIKEKHLKGELRLKIFEKTGNKNEA